MNTEDNKWIVVTIVLIALIVFTIGIIKDAQQNIKDLNPPKNKKPAH
jgi:hypothetical protein